MKLTWYSIGRRRSGYYYAVMTFQRVWTLSSKQSPGNKMNDVTLGSLEVFVFQKKRIFLFFPKPSVKIFQFSILFVFFCSIFFYCIFLRESVVADSWHLLVSLSLSHFLSLVDIS